MDNNLILEKFRQAKNKFDKIRSKEEGTQVMQKIIKIINDLGLNWNNYNGGELAHIQMRLSGFSFYLADYIAELNRISEQLKLEIKEIKAKNWDEISETIKAERGKVQNKDQIENVLIIKTKELLNMQILYETLFYQYKLKLYAVNDVLTCLTQQIAQKKQEYNQAKSLQ